jgi:hypothetical protein
MLEEMRAMDGTKVEIFKSSIMSVVETQFEFEIQVQMFIDEC